MTERWGPMRWILPAVLSAFVLLGCEQNIGSGGLAGSDRPSVVAACSQALASEPKHRDRDRDPVVINIPRPEPTVRCSKGPDPE